MIYPYDIHGEGGKEGERLRLEGQIRAHYEGHNVNILSLLSQVLFGLGSKSTWLGLTNKTAWLGSGKKILC